MFKEIINVPTIRRLVPFKSADITFTPVDYSMVRREGVKIVCGWYSFVIIDALGIVLIGESHLSKGEKWRSLTESVNIHFHKTYTDPDVQGRISVIDYQNDRWTVACEIYKQDKIFVSATAVFKELKIKSNTGKDYHN